MKTKKSKKIEVSLFNTERTVKTKRSSTKKSKKDVAVFDPKSYVGTPVLFKTSRNGELLDINGIVVDIKPGGLLMNRKTGAVTKDTFKLKIKPIDGSRAFWTDSLRKTTNE